MPISFPQECSRDGVFRVEFRGSPFIMLARSYDTTNQSELIMNNEELSTGLRLEPRTTLICPFHAYPCSSVFIHSVEISGRHSLAI